MEAHKSLALPLLWLTEGMSIEGLGWSGAERREEKMIDGCSGRGGAYGRK
jgi:hypothetical protein